MKFSSDDVVLILAPHTDDGEFGCGGTIAKMTEQGARVIYVAFSAAEQSVLPDLPRDILRTEVKKATTVLGIAPDDCVTLDFEVRRFPEFRQQILDAMIGLSEKYHPTTVFLPSTMDTHQDHHVISAEGFRAFKRMSILGYELPWNNLEFRTGSFSRLSDAHLERKLSALACYESQKHRPYADPDVMRSLARTRGVQIGHRYAESFEVIRWFFD